MKRNADYKRKTNETEIEAALNIDGKGEFTGDSGVGFFNHMLSAFIKHGMFDLNLKVKGDLEVDCHHSIEDAGIIIGKCFNDAMGTKKGIKRFGTSFVPMDESLASVFIDISGRPYLFFDCNFTKDKIGDMDTEMIEEFFRALSYNAGITIHAKVLYGKNNHHMAETLFKALGRALCEALTIDGKIEGTMSTKGCF